MPKLLFPSKALPFMAIVPACRRCNQEKQRDDQYLRDYLTIHPLNVDNPACVDASAAMLRAHKRNRSELTRHMMQNAKPMPYRGRGGLIIGMGYGCTITPGRLDAQLARMVRGLYRHRVGSLLPRDTAFEVGNVHPFELPKVYADLERGMNNGPYLLGHNAEVFGCRFAYEQEDTTKSIWLIWFYQRVGFIVLTNTSSKELTSHEP